MIKKIKTYDGFKAIEISNIAYTKSFIILDRSVSIDTVGRILYVDNFGKPEFMGYYFSPEQDVDYYYYTSDGKEYIKLVDDIF